MAACGTDTATEPEVAVEEVVVAEGATECGSTVEEIAAAAKEEGQVNLIALPDSWANYKGILESFRTTYGIEAPVHNPDASSAD